MVNVPLESDFSHLVTTREAETRKKKNTFFIVLPCWGEMDFAGVSREVLWDIQLAIRLAVEIVDIHVWSIVKLSQAE